MKITKYISVFNQYFFTRKLHIFFIIFCFFAFISKSYSSEQSQIKLGIDVLIESNFQELAGKKVLLLTNYTGRSSRGKSTVEEFINTNKCELIGVMVPEHGYFTAVPAGNPVKDDMLYGIPVYSLYGADRKPNRQLFDKCDAVVVDLQDIGVRSYTYISTMYNTIDAAAEFGKPVYVLDRPNPLGGLIVDGNVLEPEMKSFVGIIPVSYIHGNTIGELALMMNEERWLTSSKKCDLHIIKMQGWERWMVWEDTGLLWYPTSPHVPSISSVRGIATLGIFGELGFISIGIGTTSPFQYIGNLTFKSDLVLAQIKDNYLPGLELIKSVYHPFYGMYNNKFVQGLQLQFPLTNEFRPYSYGFRLILATRKIHPELFDAKQIKSNSMEMFNKVTGTKKLGNLLFNGGTDTEIMQEVNSGLSEFLILRNKYLLYN